PQGFLYADLMANTDTLVLTPHPSHDPAPKSRLTVNLRSEPMESGLLLRAEFVYAAVEGEELRLPEHRTESPARTDQLWKTTCFELFLQPEAAVPSYWEVNFNPSGD